MFIHLILLLCMRIKNKIKFNYDHHNTKSRISGLFYKNFSINYLNSSQDREASPLLLSELKISVVKS
jgi:hypothetical protein